MWYTAVFLETLALLNRYFKYILVGYNFLCGFGKRFFLSVKKRSFGLHVLFSFFSASVWTLQI